MKLIVYTTVIGPNTDALRPQWEVNPNVEYRCYTDSTLFVRGWTMYPVPPSPTPGIASRRLKILAHETLADANPDVSLWVDAAFQLHVDPWPLAEQWLWRSDMVALRHPHRTNIAQEAEAIAKIHGVPEPLINAQLAEARRSGFDIEGQTAITSTGFCMRRHTRRVHVFNETWWRLFEAGGHGRDQMTVDWALWTTNVDVHYLQGHYRDNPYAKWYPHGSKQLSRRRLLRR